ncbi:hypothetical protein [Halorussus amylolyticus]|uniref:hypothetical protein n=1 Tax=Halorussus amylolyticus TaxID=1126242 RepID=UPI0010458A3D|nr:hypothetical protein [Halorussus amylolyticus]
MVSQTAVERLPTFVALEVLSVLQGERRGASVPLDGTYFGGISRAVQALSDEECGIDPESRTSQVQQSRLLLSTASVQLDSFERDELRTASDHLYETAERLPEVEFLRSEYPGECVVVPEWLRTGRVADWGVRAYFFSEGDAPTSDEILEKNIDAVVNGTRPEFERYQGELHGYPQCCIEAFHDRTQDRPGPEWRSVEPLAARFRGDVFRQEQNPSIDDVLPEFFESEDAYSFFAREFFPEPDCATARAAGKRVYEVLREELGAALVQDYFALNYAFCYAVAKTLREQAPNQSRRPSAGELGMEHFSSYAPLSHVLTFPKYA